MKKSVIIFIIMWIGFYGIVESQPCEEWSTPVAFTDTSSYNTNPYMVARTPIIFYEKKQDQESASDIYCVNLTSYCGEMPVLSNDSITYRNPKGIDSQQMYCFYESNETGNFELYAISFDDNCNFGVPVQLTFTPEDESSLMIDRFEYKMAFLRGDEVSYAKINVISDTVYLSDIQIIDTVSGLNPVIMSGEFFYQRYESGEYHIYKSMNENTGWTVPEPVYTQGNNINLSFVNSDFGYSNVLSYWENNGNYLYYDESYVIDSFYLPPVDTVFQLSAFYYSLIANDFGSAYSFTSGFEDGQDIFFYINTININFGLENISNNDYKDSNSGLFMGRFLSDYWELYCLWETEINGHSVLYYTEQDISMENVDEEESNRLIEISPNPFCDKLQITIKNPGIPAMVEIYTLQGIKIFSAEINGGSFVWHPAKDNKNIPEGIYVVKVSQDGKISSGKVIYSKK